MESPSAARGEPALDLIEACRRGDREAFARLFDTYKDGVYAVALHLSGDAAEAGDITQDVFVKVLAKIGQFRSEARFTTWLHRVVVNTFLDRSRSLRRQVPLDERRLHEVRGGAPAHGDPADRADVAREVARSLARLGARYRTPLVLRFAGGLSYAENAAVLGISTGTVASRISRGLRSLSKSLSHLEEA